METSGLIYYPLLACNITLRFDEALLRGEPLDVQSVQKLAQSAKVAAASGAPSKKPLQKPDIFAGLGDDLSKRVGVVPKQASFELPGYRQAGKFDLTFAFRDFPLDPRAIRAVGVEIYTATVRAADFQRTMLSQGAYADLINQLVSNPANLMLAGTVDQISSSFTDKGSEVKLSGRDVRGILIDATLDATALNKLKLNQPIDKLIAQLLAFHPLSKNIPIAVASPDEWPGKRIPESVPAEAVTRVNLKAQSSGGGGSPIPGAGGGGDVSRGQQGSSNQLTFWDVITQFCYLVGAVPYFEGHVLRITPVRSLYDRKRAPAPGNPTPFANGGVRSIDTTSGQADLKYRRMVYGKNLLKFDFTRKLGGKAKPVSVKCVSTATLASKDKTSSRLVEAEWPPATTGNGVNSQAQLAASKATDVSPTGKDAKQEVLFIPVPGIKDKATLQAIAYAVFEEVGRGEMGGSASTKDLASLGGDNFDPDLVHLRPGDPVEFFVDSIGTRALPPIVSALSSVASEDEATAIAAVAATLGGDKALAAVLVKTARGTINNLQSTFRTETVRYSWDNMAGMAIDFDFKNYVEARFDILAAGTKPPTSVSDGTPQTAVDTRNPPRPGYTYLGNTPFIVRR